MDEKGTHNIEDGTYKYNSVLGNTRTNIRRRLSEQDVRARVCVSNNSVTAPLYLTEQKRIVKKPSSFFLRIQSCPFSVMDRKIVNERTKKLKNLE